MYPIPDNTEAPTAFFMPLLTDVLMKQHGLSKEEALSTARIIVETLFEAKWEIVPKRIVDAVITGAGLDPNTLERLEK